MSDYSDYLAYTERNRPSPLESIFSAIPAYNYSRGLNKYYQPAYDLSAAMTNIDSPQYQQIFKQQQSQGRRSLTDAIQELSAKNRMQSRLGRTPLFSAERGGEEQLRALLRGYQDVDTQSANQTYNILDRGYRSALQTGQQKAQNAGNKAAVNSNLYGLGGKMLNGWLGGLFGL